MSYPLIKSLHLLSIIFFTGGMLVLMASLSSGDARTMQHMRRWDRWLTTPALVMAWLTGGLLASKGGWIGAGWLSAKVVLVVLLSALHGFALGRSRRARDEAAEVRLTFTRAMTGVFMLAVAAICVLVAIKPGAH